VLAHTNPDTLYRDAIISEAYSWLRTPYVHCANIKGAGVDCAMLLREVYIAAVPHIVPQSYDPRPYSPYWYMHRTEELYILGMEKYAHRVEVADIGDIEVFRFGRTASHGGIVVSKAHLIHANRVTGNVELCERSYLATRLDSRWSVFA
jgi:cell wall-associated NlpC family hydrolase